MGCAASSCRAHWGFPQLSQPQEQGTSCSRPPCPCSQLRCLPGAWGSSAGCPSALPKGWQPCGLRWAHPPSNEAARVGVEWFISVMTRVQQGFPEQLSPPCCHPPGRRSPAGCSSGAGDAASYLQPTGPARDLPSVQGEGASGSYSWRGSALGAAGGEVGAAGMAWYFSITSRSPFWKWRSAPTVRNPCKGKACQPGAGRACTLPGTVPVPAAGARAVPTVLTHRVVGDHLPGEVHAFRQRDLHPFSRSLCGEEMQ